MPKHSQLQVQVLSLYKQFLRATEKRPGFRSYIREEFKKNSQLKKTDVLHVEYLLRRGKRQLETLTSQSVNSLGVFYKDSQE